nr:unnamed protein product [Fasciola hepatica]
MNTHGIIIPLHPLDCHWSRRVNVYDIDYLVVFLLFAWVYHSLKQHRWFTTCVDGRPTANFVGNCIPDIKRLLELMKPEVSTKTGKQI